MKFREAGGREGFTNCSRQEEEQAADTAVDLDRGKVALVYPGKRTASMDDSRMGCREGAASVVV